MTAAEIVKELKPLGGAGYKRIMLNHGVNEPVLGVKISELKKFEKRHRNDHQLALDLYDTGIYDAQYLAGLIADETKMTAKDLRRWLAKANSAPVCGFMVAALAAESAHGHKLALEWIESDKEVVAQTGWNTFSHLVALKDDADLDIPQLKRLLARVEKTIHDQPNHVRYAMNGFVIAVGGYVAELTNLAIKTAEKIGMVEVDMGNTSCEVPSAPAYIRKVQQRGAIGKKRKSARC